VRTLVTSHNDFVSRLQSLCNSMSSRQRCRFPRDGNMAFLPLMTKTPWISSSWGRPSCNRRRRGQRNVLSFFPFFAASSDPSRRTQRPGSMHHTLLLVRFDFCRRRKAGPQIFRRTGQASTTTLKSFASWLLVVVCVVAKPELRRNRLQPIFVTLPLNTCPGSRQSSASASWANFYVTMSVSSISLPKVTMDISESVIKKLPRRVLNPRHHVFAQRTGK